MSKYAEAIDAAKHCAELVEVGLDTRFCALDVGWVEAIAKTHHNQSSMRWVLRYSTHLANKQVFRRHLMLSQYLLVDFRI